MTQDMLDKIWKDMTADYNWMLEKLAERARKIRDDDRKFLQDLGIQWQDPEN